MRSVSILFALAALAACAPDPPPEPAMTEPEEAEAEPGVAFKTDFMGTREEREARAPYSPWWWPLNVGDILGDASDYNSLDLTGAGRWNDMGAVFWVDTLAFKAVFSSTLEELPNGGLILESVYEGHFPRKSKRAPEDWWHDWPAHLEGSDSADVARWLSDPGPHRNGPEPVKEGEREMWTRERWLEGWRGPGTENDQ